MGLVDFILNKLNNKSIERVICGGVSIMEFIKKFLGFVLLLVALAMGFFLVSVAAPLEVMTKYIAEDWFVKFGEYALEWGFTALIVLGLSRMLAINNKVACVITFLLWVLLSAFVVMTLHFPEELAELLAKVGLK